MITREFQVYGNLALAAEPAYVESNPRFTVIEGRGARAERSAVSGRHVSRAAVAIAATVVALLFFAVALVGWSTYASRAEAHADTLSHISFEEVRVQAGDSLWSLASQHPINDFTTQETADAIAEANELEGVVLQAGETILVPVSR